MKIISLVGARPQFIKLAPLSKEIRKGHHEKIIHTGQHFDPNMSEIFFKQMGIPEPDLNLEIAEGTHGEQTGRMLIAVEKVFLKERPDLVIVYGDTNSTLAGALSASKINIPVLHVEAGLRSHDMAMPEEKNRIITDHISTYLSCPCENAVMNLKKEGITKNTHNTGDIMFDAVLLFEKKAKQLEIFEKNFQDFKQESICVLTLHRPSNSDNREVLSQIFKALKASGKRFLFPVHPRTRQKVEAFGIDPGESVTMVEPVGYLEMLMLIKHAEKLVTDSGGMQKEALYLGTPCVTIRDTTEWTETLAGGWNTLVMETPSNLDTDRFLQALETPCPAQSPANPYGNGRAAEKIAKILR